LLLHRSLQLVKSSGRFQSTFSKLLSMSRPLPINPECSLFFFFCSTGIWTQGLHL
jgi:hypothetical protein